MTLAFDVPECKPSLVQRLDPRWKLAAIVLASVAVALVRTWQPALAALAGAIALVILARVPLRWYFRRMGTAVLMFVFFLVWLPFVIEEGHATIALGPLTVSLNGLQRLLVISAKLGCMISLMLVLLATGPLPDTFKAARSLHIPSVLVQLLLLTYRYVFLITEEFARLRTALRVRGYRNRADLHSYRTVGQVAGTLLVRSHERSERVAQAMRCRGFDGEFRALSEFATRATDVLAFVIIVGYAVGLLLWDWLG